MFILCGHHKNSVGSWQIVHDQEPGMDEQTVVDGVRAGDASDAEAWQARSTAGLQSADVRKRLEAYSVLSDKCAESKHLQRQVGALLRSQSSHGTTAAASSSLLSSVLTDLRASDRTLRIAAARVLCRVAYESLPEQEAIIRLQQAVGKPGASVTSANCGLTVGWIHIFSIPDAIRRRFEQGQQRHHARRGSSLSDYVQQMVVDNYAPVYRAVSAYYGSRCRSFLPLCWRHPRADSEDGNHLDIPDPDEHLIGFFLVPRQAQFPEPEKFFAGDLVRSIRSEDELAKLAIARYLFEQAATTSEPGCNVGHALQTNGDLDWLGAGVEKLNSLDELLVEGCKSLNSTFVCDRFGREQCDTVRAVFDAVVVPSSEADAEPFAWEPVLLGAILGHPSLSAEIKRTISLLRPPGSGDGARHRLTSVAGSGAVAISEPWQFVVSMSVREVLPVTWGRFLAKWRRAVEDSPNGGSPRERRASVVCSIEDMRRSILATNPRSYQDLDTFRQQLPGIFRSQRSFERASHASQNDHGSPSRRRQVGFSTIDDDDSANEDGSGAMHKPKNLSAALDAESRRSMEIRAAVRLERTAATAARKRRVEVAARQKRDVVSEKERTLEEKLESLELQRSQSRQLKAQREATRHQQVGNRRQRQLSRIEAKQQEIVDRIRHPQPPPEQTKAAKRPVAVTPRRPLSARPPSRRVTAEAVGPRPAELTRERGKLYGDTVCKLYAAEAARRPTLSARLAGTTRRPNVSHQAQVSRRFSTYRLSTFREKLAASKPPPPRQDSPGSGGRWASSASSTGEPSDSEDSDHSQQTELPTGVGNACATLVMRNVAQVVSERILIPSVPPPPVPEPPVPPYVVLAQYEALDDAVKRKFRERFDLQRVRHQLSFEVLKHFTRLARREHAWREFVARAGRAGDTPSIRTSEFVELARRLDVPLATKELQALARSLDDPKTGWIEWKSFYTWWCLQFNESMCND